jgi:hypothetical protein
VIVLLIILLIVGVLIDNKAFVVVVVLRFIIPLIKGVFDLQFDQRKNRTVSKTHSIHNLIKAEF